jgi:hypothetical protein
VQHIDDYLQQSPCRQEQGKTKDGRRIWTYYNHPYPCVVDDGQFFEVYERPNGINETDPDVRTRVFSRFADAQHYVENLWTSVANKKETT